MKTKLMSKGLFLEALRKLRLAIIIFCAVIVFDQVIITIMTNVDAWVPTSRIPTVIGATKVMLSLSYIPLIMTPIMMLILFSSFHARNTSDFYLALPYTRSCLAFTWTCTVLGVSLVLLFAGTFLGYAAYLIYPDLYVCSFAGFFREFFSLGAACVLSAGCVLIAVDITGTTFASVTTALIIAFLPRYLMVLARTYIVESTSALSSLYFLRFFSVDQNVLVGLIPKTLYAGLLGYYSGDTSFMNSSLWSCFYTLFVGLAAIAVGTYLFRRRKSEIAYHSAAHERVQAAIRISGGFAVSSLGTFILLDSSSNLTIATVIYIAAGLMYLAYELISTKTLNALVRALPGLLVVAILNAALAGTLEIGRLFASSYASSYSEISSVRLIGRDYYDYWSYSNFFASLAKEVPLTDPDAIDAVESALYGQKSSRNIFTSVLVALETDAGTRYCSCSFTETEFAALLNALVNNEEYQELCRALPSVIEETVEPIIDIPTYENSAASAAHNTEGLVAFRNQVLAQLQEELNTLDAHDLSDVLYQECLKCYASYYVNDTGYYVSDSITCYFIEDSANLAKYSLNINPVYFPKTASLLFEDALRLFSDDGVLDWILTNNPFAASTNSDPSSNTTDSNSSDDTADSDSSNASQGSSDTSQETSELFYNYGTLYDVYIGTWEQLSDGGYSTNSFYATPFVSIPETEDADVTEDDELIQTVTDTAYPEGSGEYYASQRGWQILESLGNYPAEPSLEAYVVIEVYGVDTLGYSQSFIILTGMSPETMGIISSLLAE